MRCFIAVPCAKEVRDALASLQTPLNGYGGMKMVEQENIHLTLKFLGEVEDAKAEAIAGELEFLRREHAFEVKVKGLGAFPNASHAKVIWAGVEDGKRLFELHERVDGKLEALGFQREDRFHPHYTIARVKHISDKDGLHGFLAGENGTVFGSYTVNSIKLMSSRLTGKGPLYSTVAGYRLI